MEWLFVPWLNQAVLLVHICAALFWLGWMGFIFFILFPVLKRTVPDSFPAIRSAVQQRTRTFVFWMIGLIVLTGLYNMKVVGLFDAHLLFETSYGHRFLVKLGAALTLFGVYFTAPLVIGHGQDEGCGDETSGGHPALGVVLHVIAFSAGITAAYLGLGL
jgi:putative copper export protein